MGQVGFLSIGMGVDTAGLKTGLSQASGVLGGFESRLGKIGGLLAGGAAAFGAYKLADVVSGAVVDVMSKGSDLAEQQSKVGVVFGDSAGIVNDAADDMAKRFGFVKTTFLDSAGSIGLIAKASGLAKPAAAALGVEFTGLAADAGSFFNVPIEEALMAIRSGLVGEAEPLRRFGVLLSEGAVEAEAARLGLAKLGAELTEAQKVQARVSLIRSGLKDAQGDLARTAGGVANLGRTVSGRVENIKADIGLAFQSVGQFVLVGVGGALESLGGIVEGNTATWKAWAASSVQQGGLVFETIGFLGKGIGLIADAVHFVGLGWEALTIGVNKAVLIMLGPIDMMLRAADALAEKLGLSGDRLSDLTSAMRDDLNTQLTEREAALAKAAAEPLPSAGINAFVESFQNKMAEAAAAGASAVDVPQELVDAAPKVAREYDQDAINNAIEALKWEPGSDLAANPADMGSAKFAGAAELGSAEARSAILNAQGVMGGDDPNLKVAQRNLTEQERHTKLLEQIAGGNGLALAEF